jgi:4-diphosphocytidyl-2-C-methyl-D-erythritol kinase
VEKHPDIDGMLESLEQGNLKGIIERLGNVLETVTVKKYPVIREIKESMLENGAEGSLMSGSGPTVFGIFTEKQKAESALEVLQEKGLAKQLFVTEFVKGGNYAG